MPAAYQISAGLVSSAVVIRPGQIHLKTGDFTVNQDDRNLCLQNPVCIVDAAAYRKQENTVYGMGDGKLQHLRLLLRIIMRTEDHDNISLFTQQLVQFIDQ